MARNNKAFEVSDKEINSVVQQWKKQAYCLNDDHDNGQLTSHALGVIRKGDGSRHLVALPLQGGYTFSMNEVIMRNGKAHLSRSSVGPCVENQKALNFSKEKEVEKYLAKLVNQFEKQAHEAMTHGLSSTKFESIYAFNGEHVTLHIPM